MLFPVELRAHVKSPVLAGVSGVDSAAFRELRQRYGGGQLVAGAMSVIKQARRRGTTPWLSKMIATKPAKVVAVAQANKTARIVWALLHHGGTYHKPQTAA